MEADNARFACCSPRGGHTNLPQLHLPSPVCLPGEHPNTCSLCNQRCLSALANLLSFPFGGHKTNTVRLPINSEQGTSLPMYSIA